MCEIFFGNAISLKKVLTLSMVGDRIYRYEMCYCDTISV